MLQKQKAAVEGLTFEFVGLKLNIDLWSQNYAFNDNFVNEIELYFNQLLFEPVGEPTKSRADAGFGTGPNLLVASMVSIESLEKLKAKALYLAQDKTNFLDVVKLKSEVKAERAQLEKEITAQNAKAEDILKKKDK